MKNKPLKYYVLLLLSLLISFPVFAEGAKSTATSGISEWALYNVVLIMGIATILGAGWFLLSAFTVVVDDERKKYLTEQGIDLEEDAIPQVVKAEPFWKKIYDRSWDLVPMEKEQDILFHHEYDGIRELDNVLPPWWVAMFYGTIAISIVFLSYYHLFDYGQSSQEAYASEVAYAEAQAQAYLSRQPNQVDENNVATVTDEGELEQAATIFNTNCVACHGISGEGGIGPNLTDKYWINGGSLNDIFKTIKYGVPAKGMIAWKSQLRPSDIQNVSNYIVSLQGTNPPNGKEPQGELYEAQ